MTLDPRSSACGARLWLAKYILPPWSTTHDAQQNEIYIVRLDRVEIPFSQLGSKIITEVLMAVLYELRGQ